MKKVNVAIGVILLSGLSINVLAATKYKVKVGSWMSAYETRSDCKASNNYCESVKLPEKCTIASIWMEKNKAKQVQTSIDKGRSVEIIEQSSGDHICTLP